MTGPDINRPRPGSNAIGSFVIGVSPIGTISSFDYWLTVISQYANSDIIDTLVQNINESIDPTVDVDAFFDNMFNIDTAIGYGLDCWGRILGVSRTLSVPQDVQFFSYQEALPGSFGFNQAPFFSGQGLTNNFNLTDAAYRVLLLAKALFNITDGSILSINTILLSLFPARGNCYVVDNLNMTMAYKFEFTPTPVELSIIGQSGVLPRPSGVDASLIIPASASKMQLSDTPVKVGVPFAFGASAGFIRAVPIPSQIGIVSGAASYTDGFPPDCFTPVSAGGEPPFGQDFNGLLFQMSGGIRWLQAGGPLFYDALLVSECGGYPKGSTLSSAVVTGKQWVSLVDNNTTNPDDPLTSTNWRVAGVPTGSPIPFVTSTLPGDYVPMNGLTIGNASSNATALADGSALFLYVFLWPNTNLPILTSGGSVTTRGANAVADFLANKQLTLLSGKGTSLKGVDTMGGAASSNLSGVPIVLGSTTAPGSFVGSNLQGLIIANLPAVIPAGTITNGGISISQNANLNNGNSTTGGGAFTNITVGAAATITASQLPSSFSGNSFGGNTAHNNTELNMLVYWGLKL